MKSKIAFLLLITLFASCNKKENTKEKLKPKKIIDTINCLPVLIDDPAFENEKVEIQWLDYTKNKLDKVEKLFFSDFKYNVENPKYLYIENHSKTYINQYGKKTTFDYDGPQGMDQYYILYAYFLQKKNDGAKYNKERKKLIEMYSLMIEIYQTQTGSLLYRDHMFNRMDGCIEYSIHQLKTYEKYFDRDYAFKKEKELYIKSLKQYIADEQIRFSKENYVCFDEKRLREAAEELINDLEKSITNYYYLEQVRVFEMQYFRL